MSDVIIVIDKQDLVDIADLVRYKSGLSDKLSLGGVYNTIRDYWPEKEYFLTFSAPETFSISVETPGWDGTLEYSIDKSSWNTWNGEEISGTELYLRGAENTVITRYDGTLHRWTLIGSNISCSGNIETLLDWETVKSGKHPEMASSCYYGMFDDCTSLTQAPELPATTLADSCYSYMFYKCTSLTQAPELPATTLASSCYYGMFYGCTSLTQAPELPATTLANYCYCQMFYCCTSLTTAPVLPATTLADSCYQYMFSECASLTQVPVLPATALADQCYYYMFGDCINIKLSSTQTAEYTQPYRIPSSGTGTTVATELADMFTNTGGTFTDIPEINTTYYLHKDCSIIGGAIEVPTPTWEWGEEGAEVDTEWFAGLKDYLLTNSGSSLTTSEGNSILGTTKSVTLTSAVLGTTTHLIRVIGVDQDANNTVTWQTANMLSSTTTFGSSTVWIGSTARSLCQNYYNYFPGKASIKTVSKGTCANYNDSRAGTVTYNDETVWLPSEREMGLDSYSPISTANSTTTNAECTYGKNFSYTYYSSNTNRVKKQGDSGSAYYYWERSRYYTSGSTNRVCLVYTDGSAVNVTYTTSYGLAPAFVIGN